MFPVLIGTTVSVLNQCPQARAIIHLGATSCYVTDNTDTIQMKEALSLLLSKITLTIDLLSTFANKYKSHACLGYTHFQPAQLTTVGKRATLWIQDLVLDREELSYRKQSLKFLGAKGATGTQASYLSLFNGDQKKVKELDTLIAHKMGFEHLFPVSGQTYTRKQDIFVLNALAGFGASCHKFATDIRLLAGLKEINEPFAREQVGSSAMPYKKNPILSERICSLSRYLIALSQNPLYTHSTQWLERSLDDSANRRLSLSEAFLTADALAKLMKTVIQGLEINETVIKKHVEEELAHLATENILMAAVKKGGDRQVLHEKIRRYCLDAAKESVEKRNLLLLNSLTNDPDISLNREEVEYLIDMRQFIGRAPEQVEEFLDNNIYTERDSNFGF